MKAVIEIPKGDDRRRHIKHDKSGFIDLGPIKNVIPVNNGIMPIHYGYLPETINEKEGDEIDVIVFSRNAADIGQEIMARPIALLCREDGDDKVVAADASLPDVKKWENAPEAERRLIEEFFGYKSKLTKVGGKEEAEKYIEAGREAFFKNENSSPRQA